MGSKRRPYLLVIATVLFGTCSYVEALVLCMAPSGALSAGAQCRPGTVPIDPSALGLVGPAGPQGPAGPAGPAGPQGPPGAALSNINSLDGIACLREGFV